MTNTRLILVWRSLTRNQKTLFDTWVRSTHVNTIKYDDVIRLYEFIRKFSPDFKDDKLSNESAAKNLFSNHSNSENYLRHVMSYLLRIMELFIIDVELKKSAAWQSLFLMKYYERNKIKSAFDQEWRDLMRILSQPDTELDGIEKSMLEWIAGELHLNAFESPQHRKPNQSLQQAMDAIDEIYLVQKLRYACEIINRHRIVHAPLDLKALDKMVIALLRYHPPKTMAGKIYQQMYELISGSIKPGSLKKLTRVIKEEQKNIPLHLVRIAWLYICNYYFHRVNSGEMSRIVPLNLAIEHMHEKHLIPSGDAGFFKSMIRAIVMNGNLALAEELARTYISDLPEEIRPVAQNYSHALILVEQKKYDEANKLLNFALEPSDLFYDLSIQLLHFKTSYLSGNLDEIAKRTPSFRHMLQRAEVPELHKKLYLNFLKFINHLAQRTRMGDINRLLREVKQEQHIWEREWLLKCIMKKIDGDTPVRNEAKSKTGGK